MSKARELSAEDRGKIEKLLESGTLENINLALSLIEQTASEKDIELLFTRTVMLELLCLGEPLLQAGEIILRSSSTWRLFVEILSDPLVMTARDYGKDERVLTAVSEAALRELARGEENLDLRGLPSLSDRGAKSLSQHYGDLYLDGLTSLSDEAAGHLGKHEGTLHLDGIGSLSTEAAESLSKHDGPLHLGGLSSLTDSVALHLVTHPDLHVPTKVKRQIRKAVSKRKQKQRKSARTGKSNLTKQQATKLRKLMRSKSAENVAMAAKMLESTDATQDDINDVLSSSILSLLVNTWDPKLWNELAPLLASSRIAKTEFLKVAEKRSEQSPLSADAFYAVATEPLLSLGDRLFSGDLNLRKLTSLSDEVAESLGKRGDEYLALPGLTSLSDAAAVSLSQFKGELSLGLTSLSDSAAESLSGCTGGLRLYDLSSLSEAAAESLGKHTGSLHLSNLSSLSDAAAAGLAKHEASIVFNYELQKSPDFRTALSDEQAYLTVPGHVALAEKLLVSRFGSSHRLDLSFLPALSESVAEVLGRCEGELDLSGVKQISDKTAESLSRHRGPLGLSGLTELSDTAAESLGKHAGTFSFCYNRYDNAKQDGLHLRGLTGISVASAESLAKSKGKLVLSGLTHLSDDAAAFLSKHDGILELDGLKSLSDAAAESLGTHELHLSLRKLKKISEEGKQYLRKNQRRAVGGGSYHDFGFDWS